VAYNLYQIMSGKRVVARARKLKSARLRAEKLAGRTKKHVSIMRGGKVVAYATTPRKGPPARKRHRKSSKRHTSRRRTSARRTSRRSSRRRSSRRRSTRNGWRRRFTRKLRGRRNTRGKRMTTRNRRRRTSRR